MRHTIVIEFPDRPTSHASSAVESAVTKAIERCPNMFDPTVFDVSVVEYHHEQMTTTDDPACDCDSGVVPGALWPMASDGDDSLPFVERCDDCKRFSDDVAAAEAVAQAVDGRVEWALVHGDKLRPQPYVPKPA